MQRLRRKPPLSDNNPRLFSNNPRLFSNNPALLRNKGRAWGGRFLSSFHAQAHHRQVVVGFCTVAEVLDFGGERLDDLLG